jgi:hypothetical protein
VSHSSAHFLSHYCQTGACSFNCLWDFLDGIWMTSLVKMFGIGQVPNGALLFEPFLLS